MTMAMIKALENLDAIASPGPWLVRYLDGDASMGIVAVANAPDDGSTGDTQSETVVAACLIRSPPDTPAGDQRWDGNAELIAEMRNALPHLLRLAKLGVAAEGGQSNAFR